MTMTQKLTSDILAVCLLVLLLVLLVLLVLWWTLRRSRYKPTAASHRHISRTSDVMKQQLVWI